MFRIRSSLEPRYPRYRRPGGWCGRDRSHDRPLWLLRRSRRGRLASRARLLQRLEVDERKIVGEDGVDLAGFGLREVALRLDHEEARRQPHLEALLFRVEPLLGELARRPRRRDALRIHVDLPARIAHLLNGASFAALQA